MKVVIHFFCDFRRLYRTDLIGAWGVCTCPSVRPRYIDFPLLSTAYHRYFDHKLTRTGRPETKIIISESFGERSNVSSLSYDQRQDTSDKLQWIIANIRLQGHASNSEREAFPIRRTFCMEQSPTTHSINNGHNAI